MLYLVVSSGALALVWRRRYPLTVAVYLATHMFVIGVPMPAATATTVVLAERIYRRALLQTQVG